MKLTIGVAAWALFIGAIFAEASVPDQVSKGDAKAAQAKKPANDSYELGPDSRPHDGVPRGKLEGPILFKCKTYPGTVRQLFVYVPASYAPEKPACVMLFHDGHKAVNPEGTLRAPFVFDNLIHRKELPVTIGIFVSPGQRGDVFPDDALQKDVNNRGAEYNTISDKYGKMILEEILPEVAKKYNLTKDPDGRGTFGSSSGAIAAFTLAWNYPGEFRKVGCIIGSFALGQTKQLPDLIRKSDKKPLHVFLQAGEAQGGNAKENRAMLAALKEKGYDVNSAFGTGGHTNYHGGAILPDILRWLWREYPGVVPRKDGKG